MHFSRPERHVSRSGREFCLQGPRVKREKRWESSRPDSIEKRRKARQEPTSAGSDSIPTNTKRGCLKTLRAPPNAGLFVQHLGVHFNVNLRDSPFYCILGVSNFFRLVSNFDCRCISASKQTPIGELSGIGHQSLKKYSVAAHCYTYEMAETTDYVGASLNCPSPICSRF